MNIPVECLQLSPEEASKDKQLVERLEGEFAVFTHSSNFQVHHFKVVGVRTRFFPGPKSR